MGHPVGSNSLLNDSEPRDRIANHWTPTLYISNLLSLSTKSDQEYEALISFSIS